jgi:hypothetical protein
MARCLVQVGCFAMVHDKARALLSRSSFKQELPLRHRGALVNRESGRCASAEEMAGWSQVP